MPTGTGLITGAVGGSLVSLYLIEDQAARESDGCTDLAPNPALATAPIVAPPPAPIEVPAARVAGSGSCPHELLRRTLRLLEAASAGQGNLSARCMNTPPIDGISSGPGS